jgi:hypothetical protein
MSVGRRKRMSFMVDGYERVTSLTKTEGVVGDGFCWGTAVLYIYVEGRAKT